MDLVILYSATAVYLLIQLVTFVFFVWLAFKVVKLIRHYERKEGLRDAPPRGEDQN